MTELRTKTDLMQQLRDVQHQLTETTSAMPASQFHAGTEESWSAAGYLKHLILSIKPFAKAMKMPPDRLEKRFGLSDRPSVTYDEMVAKYQSRLDEGIRAEDFNPVTPSYYRVPEEVEDEKTYLIETWNESNTRLLDALEQWSEEDLDSHQIPHPAVGLITLREMVFFTVYHNTLHWNDIRSLA